MYYLTKTDFYSISVIIKHSCHTMSSWIWQVEPKMKEKTPFEKCIVTAKQRWGKQKFLYFQCQVCRCQGDWRTACKPNSSEGNLDRGHHGTSKEMRKPQWEYSQETEKNTLQSSSPCLTHPSWKKQQGSNAQVKTNWTRHCWICWIV